MSTRPHRVLQCNINHSAGAQDLLVQSLAEWSIDLAVVTEPYAVPDRATWFGDTAGVVAIAGTAIAEAPPLSLVCRGQGYVAVEWGGTKVVGVYASPNRPLRELEDLLEVVGAIVIGSPPSPTLVAGDLNAKHRRWGSLRSDARGEAVWEWAVATGLSVLNRGSENTCVRRDGGSVVEDRKSVV